MLSDPLNTSDMTVETAGSPQPLHSEEMMTPEGMMEEANESFASALIDFNYYMGKPSKPSFICFVEGYDHEYYHGPVTTLLSSDNVFIKCGGKKNVVKMHAKLSSNVAYANLKTLYFVDRDYDDYELSSDFFITDYYAVENYYCSHSVLDNILQNFCHINIARDRERCERIHADFDEWAEKFINATRPFCAWYKTARDSEIPKKKRKKYKTGFPGTLATISGKGIKIIEPQYDLAVLNTHYTPNPIVTQQQFDENLHTITSLGEIRGKFVLQFMEAYLLHLNASDQGQDALIEKPFGFQCHKPTLMSNLASCADIPERLKDYIRSRG